MTLAFKYAKSRFLDVVSVSDVGAAEERVDNNLIEVLNLRLG